MHPSHLIVTSPQTPAPLVPSPFLLSPQRPSRHLWWRAEEGRISHSQKPSGLPPPPPVDPAEQILSLSHRSALFQLRSGYCTRLMTCRWAWPMTPFAPTAMPLSNFFSCPTHPTDLAPGDMWTALLQVAQFLAGIQEFSEVPTLQVNFNSVPP